MDKAQIFLQMEILIRANIKRESLMARVSILGKIRPSMLESSGMVSNTAREDGRVLKDRNPAINMKVITKMTRNMDMVCLHGQVEIPTRVNTRMMREMDTVK